MKRALVAAIVGVAFLQQGGVSVTAQSSPQGTLNYFKGYFGNIDHVVGGVGLSGLGDSTGFATGTIHIGAGGNGAVPPNADISAAYLYWLSMESSTDPSSSTGKFDGKEIVGKQIAPAGVQSCKGSGGGGTTSGAPNLRVYRADVLRYLPVSTDPNTLGKVLINDADLPNGHQVSLRDTGGGGTQSPSSGNQATRTEGASLFIVYRDRTTLPFKALVIYDGGQTADANNPVFDLTLKGFYQATGGTNAKITYLVGDGDLSKQEALSVDGTTIAINTFQSMQGQSWDNPTFTVNIPEDHGSLRTRVDPVGTSIDCLSFAAVAVSVPVKDTDGDGLLDVWETSTATNPVLDPNGVPLPLLGDMGADPSVPDIFFEFGYLTAPRGTTYGLPGAQVTTTEAHSHLPTKAALDLAASAFKNAGITPHFDVGPNYQPLLPPSAASCATATTWTPDCAVIKTVLAKGGQHTAETACGEGGTTNCQFANFPGTVGWKSGFQYFRDEVFGFDPRRISIFHYVLSAHALGLPRSDDPALSLFHVPRTNSGMGDVGGGDVLLTTGAFGNNFTGQDPVVGGTLAHEAGHNLERRHAGESFQPNCKPNYLSVMNYIFQFGFTGPNGPAIAFSGQVLNDLDQTNLNDHLGLTLASGSAPIYPTRWYAPKLTSFLANKSTGLDVAPVTKHCDGTSAAGEPETVRVDGVIATVDIDWLNDGDVTDTALHQDINFNGGLTPFADGPLTGSNDIVPMKQYGLQQLASRPNMGVLSLDVSLTDLDPSDPGRGDPGRGDPGRGDPGRGDPGRGDPGRGDPGRGDPGRGDPGAPPGDLDLTTAAAAGGGPHTLKADQVLKVVVLTWQPPLAVPEGRTVRTYSVYRVDGGSVTPGTFAKKNLVGSTTSTTLNDTKVSPGKTYTWWAIAEFDNGDRTYVSNFVTRIIQ